MNKSKAFGVVTLFVKLNFLVAGIALWQMPVLEYLFLQIPFYQVVGTTLFAVLIYMELKPYFAARREAEPRKKGKKGESKVEAAGLSYLEA